MNRFNLIKIVAKTEGQFHIFSAIWSPKTRTHMRSIISIVDGIFDFDLWSQSATVWPRELSWTKLVKKFESMITSKPSSPDNYLDKIKSIDGIELLLIKQTNLTSKQVISALIKELEGFTFKTKPGRLHPQTSITYDQIKQMTSMDLEGFKASAQEDTY